MSLLHEVTLERLWSKYESRFGAPPPITNAGFDEAISLIRDQLKGLPADEEGSIDRAICGAPIGSYPSLADLGQQFSEINRPESIGAEHPRTESDRP